jgi:hypothetical protein
VFLLILSVDPYRRIGLAPQDTLSAADVPPVHSKKLTIVHATPIPPRFGIGEKLRKRGGSQMKEQRVSGLGLGPPSRIPRCRMFSCRGRVPERETGTEEKRVYAGVSVVVEKEELS